MSRAPSFDHAEARRLRDEEHKSYSEISRILGVSIDAVRYAAAPDRKERTAAAVEYIKQRRAKGLHYDYTPCPNCGRPRDKRREACADCYAAKRRAEAEAALAEKQAERDRVRAVRDELYEKVMAMTAAGARRCDIALELGLSEQAVYRWRKFGPARPTRRGRVAELLAENEAADSDGVVSANEVREQLGLPTHSAG